MPEVQDLGSAFSVVMAVRTYRKKGSLMAHDEKPLTADPSSHGMTDHVRDYELFTKMFKWGAVACFIAGMIVLMILH